jgi:hypothetical protein
MAANCETIRNEIISISELRYKGIQKLISLAEEQRNILVTCRHDELPENLNKHEPILDELARLDKREDALEAQLSQLKTKDNISTIFNQKQEQAAIKTAYAMRKLRSLVESNAELLQNMMNYVNYTIAVIAKIVRDQPSYDPRSEAMTTSAVVFDQMV